MRAHLVQLDGGVMSQQLMDTVCLLAALQHRARGETDLPSLLVVNVLCGVFLRYIMWLHVCVPLHVETDALVGYHL